MCYVISAAERKAGWMELKVVCYVGKNASLTLANYPGNKSHSLLTPHLTPPPKSWDMVITDFSLRKECPGGQNLSTDLTQNQQTYSGYHAEGTLIVPCAGLIYTVVPASTCILFHDITAAHL